MHFDDLQSLPTFPATRQPTREEILFVPLGGSGEIGMNLNLYGHDESWIGIDCGISFAGPDLPGIDVVLPDHTFMEQLGTRMQAMIITHAHEDHLGALVYLWHSTDWPIYATRFACEVLKGKLAREGFEPDGRIHELDLDTSWKIGPFELELLVLNHSIPEPNAVIIRTAAGTVMHSGDWKIDPQPGVGKPIDEQALVKLGQSGVDALVCDSTNAMEAGWSRSEGDVQQSLAALIQSLSGTVAVTCFASNIARLKSLGEIAAKNGRKPILAGPALSRMAAIAQKCGYLGTQQFRPSAQFSQIPSEERLVICTGSQGEPNAALMRIANGSHRDIRLRPDDHVVFSSRVIPGNEQRVAALQNQLIYRGIHIHQAGHETDIHASGHPNQEELAAMYGWIKPQIAVPVHGEARHQLAHARLAKFCQIPKTILPSNGGVYRLACAGADDGDYGAIGQVQAGKMLLDGDCLIESQSPAIAERRKLALQGCVMVAIADGELPKSLPRIGLSVLGIELEKDEVSELERLVQHHNVGRNDASLVQSIKKALRHRVRELTGKKPLIEVHILHLD